MNEEPITEDWLKEVGFRWHQFDRQPNKQWMLWLGNATDAPSATEDIGIEVAPVGRDDKWFCWFRGDISRRYSRFIHIRTVSRQGDIVGLVEAITGQPWNPANHFFGSCLTSKNAELERRAEVERLDRQMLRDSPKWLEIEEDATRGGALPEHMEKAEFGKDH